MDIMKRIRQSNRTVYITDKNITLQSYAAYVANIDKNDGTLTLGPSWHYSQTTWKHVRKFIEEYIHYLNAQTHADMLRMFNSKNGRAYMQKLVDNCTVAVQDYLGGKQYE